MLRLARSFDRPVADIPFGNYIDVVPASQCAKQSECLMCQKEIDHHTVAAACVTSQVLRPKASTATLSPQIYEVTHDFDNSGFAQLLQTHPFTNRKYCLTPYGHLAVLALDTVDVATRISEFMDQYASTAIMDRFSELAY